MENRRYRRWDIEREANLAEVSCLVKDISFMGAKVYLKQPFPLDKTLNVTVDLGPDVGQIEAESKIAWQKKLEDEICCGLYFTKIRDLYKQRIYSYLSLNKLPELNKIWWQDL